MLNVLSAGRLVLIDESRLSAYDGDLDYDKPTMILENCGDQIRIVTGQLVPSGAVLPYVSLHESNLAVMPFARVYLERLGATWEKCIGLHRRDHSDQEWFWQQQELFIVRFLTLRLCQRAYMRQRNVDWQAVIDFEIDSLLMHMERKVK